MNKEFIPYEQALALKKLGFDEPCIAKYNVPGDLITAGCYTDSHITHLIVEQSDICEAHVLAPLYQQAFRWFREKYAYQHSIYYHKSAKFECRIVNDSDNIISHELFGNMYITYEEAELECLKELIEVCKKH